jgi:oligopeptide/dipeptide ABC transporter ATP-binding protein
MLLELRDVTTELVAGDRRAVVVDRVSLTVEEGATVALVGESGAGKSVLARSIMRLLPAGATVTGSIRFDGRELTALSTAEMRELWGTEIALLLQDPTTALNPVMRIGDQIAEGPRQRRGLTRRAAARLALDLLDAVGISDPARRAREHPHQLSGGMRQRVALAIALACEPRLLLADEPTTALDVTVQAQILDLLGAPRRRPMATLLVTHDLAIAAQRADVVAVMYAGQLLEVAPARALFSATRSPYTRGLLQSIPRLDGPAHARLQTIPGRPPAITERRQGCPLAPRCARARPRCLRESPAPIAGLDAHEHLVRCWYPLEPAAPR